jgi:prephenate dehydrogenase
VNFTVTVIGTKGRMGAMLCETWAANHAVRGVDLNGKGLLCPEETAAAVSGSNAVFLCIPAPALTGVLDCIVPHMRKDQILADVYSVKMIPMREMEKRFHGPVVGAHPLFGPENERNGAKVAVVPGKNSSPEHVERITGLFAELGAVCFMTTAEEHDKAVAISQSLHFALSAAYFATAANHEGLEPYITPSFNRYRDAAQKELTVNAPMFCEFSKANPMLPEALEALRALLKDTQNGALPAIAARAST